MPVCHTKEFVLEVDKGIALRMRELEPSDELIRTAFNLHLIARQIVSMGGFPDGTKMDLNIGVDPDSGAIGDVNFEFSRKGSQKVYGFDCYMGDEMYSHPESFDELVRKMQHAAIALRERMFRCN